MNRRRFIAALGAIGMTRPVRGRNEALNRQEFACTSELQSGVVPNLVAAKVRVSGPNAQATARGFLQYASDSVTDIQSCRLLDQDLLNERWNPHMMTGGARPSLEQLVTDADRLRFEISFRSLPNQPDQSWRRRGGMRVTVDEAKLFLPAVLLESDLVGPFHFVVSHQGVVLETLKADSRPVSFKEGRIEGLTEFSWWQREDPKMHTLVERLASARFLVVALCDHQKFPLLTFRLNLESLTVVKSWVAKSVEHMARNHRKRECRPLTSDAECFLTTATVGAIGLADDCWELRTLRRFRDQTLNATQDGRCLVAEYYRIAPRIVRRINARSDAMRIWRRAYLLGVAPSALLVRLKLPSLAIALYRAMTHRLIRFAE